MSNLQQIQTIPYQFVREPFCEDFEQLMMGWYFGYTKENHDVPPLDHLVAMADMELNVGNLLTFSFDDFLLQYHQNVDPDEFNMMGIADDVFIYGSQNEKYSARQILLENLEQGSLSDIPAEHGLMEAYYIDIARMMDKYHMSYTEGYSYFDPNAHMLHNPPIKGAW